MEPATKVTKLVPKLYVAFDFAHVSPAMGFFFNQKEQYHLRAFAQRKDENGFKLLTPNADVKLFPYYKNMKYDVEKQQHVIDNCLNEIIQYTSYNNIPKKDVHVFVEDYVFVKFKQNGNHKLHEMTGILKFMLFREGFRNIYLIKESEWKAYILKNRFGKKADTEEMMAHTGPCVHFSRILNLTKRKNGKPKKPAEDLADVSAILKYAIDNYADLDTGNSEGEFSSGSEGETNALGGIASGENGSEDEGGD